MSYKGLSFKQVRLSVNLRVMKKNEGNEEGKKGFRPTERNPINQKYT